MKKTMMIVFTLMMTAMSLSAVARDYRDSRDDRPIVRISVGQDRNQDTHRRIQRLEEAVRDLQDMVYDLQDDRRDRVFTEYVCALKTNFQGTFIGKGSAKIEAQANAVNACKRSGAAFCESTQQQCEQTEIRR